MKKQISILLITIATLIGCRDNTNKQTSIRECPVVSVRFSPGGGVTKTIVENILSAEDDIRIQAFSFTSLPIANALIDSKKSGKTVEVILDRENLHNKNSVIKLLYNGGVSIYIDDRHAIAHNKIIILDKNQVLTGSFNLSKSAEESNAENSISISDIKVAEIYFENWSLHKDHSYVYSPEQ